MTPERLDQIFAAYGANPDRWPESERAEALAFLARSPNARWEAAALDRVLDAYVVPRADAAMIGRALKGFAASGSISLLQRWWLAPLLAGAGALGLALGALTLTLLPEEHHGWLDDHTSIFSAGPGDDAEEVSL